MLGFVAYSTSIAVAVIGLYLLHQKRENAAVRSFSTFCFTLAIWLVVHYISMQTLDILHVRLSMFFAVFLHLFLFLFALQFFSQMNIRVRNIISLIVIVVSLCVAALSLTEYVFLQMIPMKTIAIPEPGSGIAIFSIYSFSILFYSFIILITAIKERTGIKREQAIVITSSLFLMLSSQALFIFIAVNVFQDIGYMYIAYICSAIFVAAASYALTRLRFLGAYIQLKRRVFEIMILLAASILFFMIVASLISPHLWNTPQAVIAIVISYIVFSEVVRRFIQKISSAIAIHNQIDVIKTSHAAGAIDTLHEVRSAVMQIVGALQVQLARNIVSVFVYQSHKAHYIQLYPEGSNTSLYSDDAFITQFHESTASVCMVKELQLGKNAKLFSTNNSIIVLRKQQEIIGFIEVEGEIDANISVEEYTRTLTAALRMQSSIGSIQQNLKRDNSRYE